MQALQEQPDLNSAQLRLDPALWAELLAQPQAARHQPAPQAASSLEVTVLSALCRCLLGYQPLQATAQSLASSQERLGRSAMEQARPKPEVGAP